MLFIAMVWFALAINGATLTPYMVVPWEAILIWGVAELLIALPYIYALKFIEQDWDNGIASKD